jgi:anti-anti-sigma factor
VAVLEGRDGGTLVAITGELDIAAEPAVAEALASATARTGPLVVDLTPTSFMDSTGLKLLAATARQVGDRLAVVCPLGTPVRRVLDIAGMVEAVRVVERVEDLG